MSKIYTFHSDSQHGWLAVKRSELIQLGILEKISPYSYQSDTGKTVYLEEDGDADLFFKRYEEMFGTKPAHKSSYQENTMIRRLNNFNSKSQIDIVQK